MPTITQLNNTILELQQQLNALRGRISDRVPQSTSENFETVLLKQDQELGNYKLEVSDTVGAIQDPILDTHSESLLVETEEEALTGKPTLHTFMAKTGVDVSDGTEILYGVIGTNADLRDWSKIMASTDPLLAARKATGEMYSSDVSYELKNHPAFGTIHYAKVLDESSIGSADRSSSGLAFERFNFKNGAQNDVLVSSSNLMLRSVDNSPEVVKRVSWLFGLDA